MQDARDEGLTGQGQAGFIIGIVEGVFIAFEQRHVRVHRRARVLLEWLGHERGAHAVAQCHLLDDVAEAHHVIRHGQRIREAQIDFLLAGGVFVVRELHGDAHAFQGVDGIRAEVRGFVSYGLVEVAAGIRGHRWLSVGFGGLHQEELDFRVDVAGKAHLCGSVHLSTQNLPRIRP